tara:strand:+ start:1638 stop:1757 length:120 start_codon:yes stop_codon:yes gene_type:complete
MIDEKIRKKWKRLQKIHLELWKKRKSPVYTERIIEKKYA